jgi:glutamate formiminotransferase/formiminotetrahydrofolate cyclodeaminase
MEAFGMPKGSDLEKAARRQAIQDATRYATEIPLKVMKRTFDSFELLKAMAEGGNPNSVSDAGVGALAARSAVLGAFLNVKINAAGLDDKDFASHVLSEGRGLEAATFRFEAEILKIVNGKIGV